MLSLRGQSESSGVLKAWDRNWDDDWGRGCANLEKTAGPCMLNIGSVQNGRRIKDHPRGACIRGAESTRW